MRFAIVKNGKELGERAFLEIKKVLDEKPDAVIGFATGNTPVPLYERMAEDHKRNGTSYKRVRAFNLDEYVGVDPNDKASFARFMRDNLFSKIDIDPANTDIPNGMAEDLAAECARYSAAVREHPADIQILGIGENGHIAFNEPYTKPDEPTHIALLTASTRAANAGAFKDPSLVPQYALTMGIDEILTAKRILMLATGEKKAQAIYDMVMGRDDTSCPATALRRHPDVVVVVDREAAELLKFDEWEKAAEMRAAEAAAAAAEEELAENAPEDAEEETAAEEPASSAEESEGAPETEEEGESEEEAEEPAEEPASSAEESEDAPETEEAGESEEEAEEPAEEPASSAEESEDAPETEEAGESDEEAEEPAEAEEEYEELSDEAEEEKQEE